MKQVNYLINRNDLFINIEWLNELINFLKKEIKLNVLISIWEVENNISYCDSFDSNDSVDCNEEIWFNNCVPFIISVVR